MRPDTGPVARQGLSRTLKGKNRKSVHCRSPPPQPPLVHAASSIPLSYLHEEQKGIRSIFVLTSHAFPRKAHFPSLKINGMMRRAWWSIRA
ncbi:hypothetical protein HZH68_002359 [Vespula germanica]|uniref:Uncharacterized protein n=3 Tax=Vespula TaxID=7451 RepID=A0A834NLM6_VESGE|nr:hypothetical protein HZH66_002124 [Vespula vulgaris]KAF7413870.1 hypothetical protein HZH68_002359 [Vespula germanica]KAF7434426.1 hypothetical protein H0235_002617 [Vespula pensylvanica]